MAVAVDRRRASIRVEGVVQGVGFRPFVNRLADELGLGGWVLNDARGVLLEVEGEAEAIEGFLARLVAEAPPLARVQGVEVSDRAPTGERAFAIRASATGGEIAAPVTPDAATCEDCLAELFDPADRRHRYPFINCTNCGPRFTIVTGVPYDRPRTTMAGFDMCAECRREYEDPADRRFHAQPNACPRCGPRLSVPLEAAAAVLRGGGIVAVKGLGGHHLACLAAGEDAVARLRARKHREDKPFALMVAGVEDARALVELGAAEERLLRSPARPIVLAPRRPGAAVAAAVAPRSRELGVMLAYSPLHHLLLADVGETLVMTSGNVSDEPIAYEDEDAAARLGGIADLILAHDRPIHMRTDDSVVRVAAGRAVTLRRSRGYVPGAIALPMARTPLLACGAELKSTFCLAKGGRAWVGHHIGDLSNWETLRSFREGVVHFQRLFDVAPEAVVCDLHPEYLSTKYAVEREAEEGLQLIGVQHHHAHLAACLAEHGLEGPAAGAIYDGTGYGADGTVWGGEILRGDPRDLERVGHLFAVPMPGGEAAIREPWRMACSWLLAAGVPPPRALVERVGEERWRAVSALAERGVAAPLTSSMGRLFDAVAALCGGVERCNYEGQAAVELEGLADPGERGAYELPGLDGREAVRAACADLSAGVAPAVVSARFHNGVARATAEALGAAGCEAVVLSGGVFQNRLLLERTTALLERAGHRVLVPELLPANDGGISFGQAAIAAARMAVD